MTDYRRQNETLLRRVRSGDNAARAELAEANLGLVYHTADRIMAGSWAAGPMRWQQREELIERGYHGLCKACASVERVRTSVSGYLATAIYRGMTRGDAKLVKWLPPKRHVYQAHDGQLDRRLDWRSHPERLFYEADERDTLRLVYWLCGDEVDRRIIDRRRQRMSFAAVARDLGLLPAEIRKRLLRIEVDFWRIRKSG